MYGVMKCGCSTVRLCVLKNLRDDTSADGLAPLTEREARQKS